MPDCDTRLDTYARRVQEDYANIAVYIRAVDSQDPDVQAAAQDALNHLRLVIGKLAWLAVMMQEEED